MILKKELGLKMINSVIDFELAKLLNDNIYGEDKYAAENLKVTFDNYLGSLTFKEGEIIPNSGNIHGRFYMAPTYADVIDWLFCKNIVIEFIPAFTFSLSNHIAYYYKVYKINNEEAKLDLLFEDTAYMSSFELSIKNIVKKLVEEKHISIYHEMF